MAIFNSYVSHYQRVPPEKIPQNSSPWIWCSTFATRATPRAPHQHRLEWKRLRQGLQGRENDHHFPHENSHLEGIHCTDICLYNIIQLLTKTHINTYDVYKTHTHTYVYIYIQIYIYIHINIYIYIWAISKTLGSRKANAYHTFVQ